MTRHSLGEGGLLLRRVPPTLEIVRMPCAGAKGGFTKSSFILTFSFVTQEIIDAESSCVKQIIFNSLNFLICAFEYVNVNNKNDLSNKY